MQKSVPSFEGLKLRIHIDYKCEIAKKRTEYHGERFARQWCTKAICGTCKPFFAIRTATW